MAAEPPFKDMVVMLLVSDEQRRQLHNLWAKTCNTKATTHAFVSPSLIDMDSRTAQISLGGDTMRIESRKMMRQLQDHGLRYVREDCIVEMLIEGPSLSRR